MNKLENKIREELENFIDSYDYVPDIAVKAILQAVRCYYSDDKTVNTQRKTNKEENEMEKEIELGDTVKDKVTGFTGVATSRVEFLNGCIQYGVKPKVSKDNVQPEVEYIDEEQLLISKIKRVKVDGKRTGGMQTDTPKY